MVGRHAGQYEYARTESQSMEMFFEEHAGYRLSSVPVEPKVSCCDGLYANGVAGQIEA